MAKLAWDEVGTRTFETGVDHGVLYLPDEGGAYTDGVAWNGLVTVTESPAGAEPNPQYADNIKYLNLISAEDFAATLEAFTYPDEFLQFDGISVPVPGVTIGQQRRKSFGLSYRSRIGNDLLGDSAGYKLHLVYGCTAKPSEKAYSSVNDSPEAITFSYEIATTPVALADPDLRPTSLITINSIEVDATALAALEDLLYGTTGSDPSLPTPDEVLALFGGTITEVETVAPTYNATTDIITIPSVAGVEYLVDGDVVPAGPYGPITEDTVVTARPAAGYSFTETSDNDWTINFS